MTKWAVYYIGNHEEAKMFAYELIFHRRSPSLFSKLVIWKSPCTVAPSDDSRIISSKCLHANIYLLDSHCTGEGDLCFTVTIRRDSTQESAGEVRTFFGLNITGLGEE